MPRVFSGEDFSGFLSKIRIEDFFAPIWIVYLLRRRKEATGIIGSFMLGMLLWWIFFIIIFTFTNSIVRDYPLWGGIAFAGKEIQFLLYFCFFAVFARRNPKAAILSFTICPVPIFVYALWQCYQGDYNRGYYGIQFPFEVGGFASSEIGAISAILFVSYFVIMMNRKRVLAEMGKFLNAGIYPYTLLAFLVLMLTISKSNIIGALAAVLILTLLRTLQTKFSPLSIALPAIIMIAAFFIIQAIPLYEIILGRFMVLLSYSVPDRMGGWAMLLDYQFRDLFYDPFAVLVGFGLSSPGFLTEGVYYGLNLGVDSQYIRRLFEVGVIGTTIWLGLLLSIGIRIIKNTKGTVYYSFFRDLVIGLYILVIVASFGLELLQVIRIASTFYALMGSLLGLSFIVLKHSHKEKCREGSSLDVLLPEPDL